MILSFSPKALTSKTSDIVSISSFNLFAILSSDRISKSPEIPIARTGNLDKLTSRIFGSSESSGSLLFIKSTFSLVSDNAFTESNPASNSKTTFPPP